MIDLNLVFRFTVLFYTLMVAYLTYDIYKMTKGGSKAWLYFALGNIFGFLWAFAEVLFLDVFHIVYLRDLFGGLAIFLIAFFVLPSGVEFSKSFNTKAPKWYNNRNMLLILCLIFISLSSYNLFFGGYSTVFSMFYWVVTFVLGISFLLASMGFYYVMRSTRILPWKLWFIYLLFLGMGITFMSYSINCCGEKLYSQEQFCVESVYTLTKFLPVSCNPFVFQITKIGNFFQSTSAIFTVIATFIIWRIMKFK